jgi:YD repeat-containing protein
MATRKLLLPLMVVLLFSCVKQQDAKVASGPLKSIRIQWRDTLMYRMFEYDSQDRLTRIIDSNDNQYVVKRSIIYNSANQMVKVTSTDQLYVHEMVFAYNNNGQIIKKDQHYITPSNGSASTMTYGYDSQGRLIADSVSDGIYLRRATNFTYGQNNNIPSWQYSSWNYSTNSIQTHSGYNLTYGTQDNPFKTLGSILYFIYGEWRSLSNNNIMNEYYGPENVVYNYQYNQAGLPLKMTINYTHSPDSFIYDFFY